MLGEVVRQIDPQNYLIHNLPFRRAMAECQAGGLDMHLILPNMVEGGPPQLSGDDHLLLSDKIKSVLTNSNGTMQHQAKDVERSRIRGRKERQANLEVKALVVQAAGLHYLDKYIQLSFNMGLNDFVHEINTDTLKKNSKISTILEQSDFGLDELFPQSQQKRSALTEEGVETMLQNVKVLKSAVEQMEEKRQHEPKTDFADVEHLSTIYKSLYALSLIKEERQIAEDFRDLLLSTADASDYDQCPSEKMAHLSAAGTAMIVFAFVFLSTLLATSAASAQKREIESLSTNWEPVVSELFKLGQKVLFEPVNTAKNPDALGQISGVHREATFPDSDIPVPPGLEPRKVYETINFGDSAGITILNMAVSVGPYQRRNPLSVDVITGDGPRLEVDGKNVRGNEIYVLEDTPVVATVVSPGPLYVNTVIQLDANTRIDAPSVNPDALTFIQIFPKYTISEQTDYVFFIANPSLMHPALVEASFLYPSGEVATTVVSPIRPHGVIELDPRVISNIPDEGIVVFYSRPVENNHVQIFSETLVRNLQTGAATVFPGAVGEFTGRSIQFDPLYPLGNQILTNESDMDRTYTFNSNSPYSYSWTSAAVPNWFRGFLEGALGTNEEMIFRESTDREAVLRVCTPQIEQDRICIRYVTFEGKDSALRGGLSINEVFPPANSDIILRGFVGDTPSQVVVLTRSSSQPLEVLAHEFGHVSLCINPENNEQSETCADMVAAAFHSGRFWLGHPNLPYSDYLSYCTAMFEGIGSAATCVDPISYGRLRDLGPDSSLLKFYNHSIYLPMSLNRY